MICRYRTALKINKQPIWEWVGFTANTSVPYLNTMRNSHLMLFRRVRNRQSVKGSENSSAIPINHSRSCSKSLPAFLPWSHFTEVDGYMTRVVCPVGATCQPLCALSLANTLSPRRFWPELAAKCILDFHTLKRQDGLKWHWGWWGALKSQSLFQAAVALGQTVEL